MGDGAVAAAPTAPAPTNGSATKGQAPAAPAPTKDIATGNQLPGAPSRGTDGKFLPRAGDVEAKPPEAKAKLRIRDQEYDEDAAHSMIERGKQAGRLLTESQKRVDAAEAKERADTERRRRVKESGDLSGVFEGLDLTAEQERDILAKYLYGKHLEPAQMTEEQRAAREHQKRAEAAEGKLKDIETKAAVAEQQRAAIEARGALEKELLDAAKAGRIPGGMTAVRRVARKMEELEKRDLSVPLEQVVASVREDVGRETGEFVESADIAELKELWGEKAFKAHARKVQSYLLGQLRPGPTGPAAPTRQPMAQKPSQKLTPQQFLDMQSKRR